ncbi:MAG: amidohydrolase family protein [Chromatiales bacterium]|jgi:N-acyl-D-aspartate/D-glutamate deacylase|nr:amidohydrolase family protein [Chromatiales bacterium]
MQPNLIVRGGTVVDGTGREPFEADVAIAGGSITAVGKVKASAATEIDARGRIVTPGFVDVHTHYDAQATWANHLTPSSFNGVTTVLMGNCGVGFAPVRPHQHDMLIELMEGVEDIPEVVLNEGLPWTWESFPEYLDTLAGRQYDVDVATQVPHAALRVYVMGQRGADREPATAADRQAMAALAAQGVAAGAFGFSTSRLLQHRTAGGDPIPSYGAAEDELTEIVVEVAKVGRPWIQVVADFGERQEEEFGLLRRLVERSGLPLTLTLLQVNRFPDEWRELLQRIAKVNAAGHVMTGQTRGRPTSTLLGFELSNNPFRDCPSWSRVAEMPMDARVEALRDVDFKALLLSEPAGTPLQERRTRSWARIFELGDPPQYEPPPETSIAARAARDGVEPAALAYDLMLQANGRALLYHPTTNYVSGSMAPVYDMLRHPNTLIGLGDGGAHVGVMCDATDLTHTLTYWTRDRVRGDRFPLEYMVHRITQANALAIGLTDRGTIAPGQKADLNVIDYDRLQLGVPAIHYDLPAGGKRLLQPSVGYDATVVSGEIVWEFGRSTGRLPGRLLRRGR